MSQAVLSWPRLTLLMQTAMVTMDGGSAVIRVLWAHLNWFLQLGWRLGLQGNRGLRANQFGLLFSVFRTFPDHLKSRDSGLSGIASDCPTRGMSSSLKLSSRKLVYSVFEIWIYDLKCILWWFVLNLVASLSLSFSKFQELSGILWLELEVLFHPTF